MSEGFLYLSISLSAVSQCKEHTEYFFNVDV